MKKNPTRCNIVSKFYYSLFIWSSTCFGRHTTHHQEPKSALAASGFSYVQGCWMCSWLTLSGTYDVRHMRCQAHTLSGTYVPDNDHQLHVLQPSTYEKPVAASAGLGSWWWAVSPETCWASYKNGIIKFWYTVVSCWIFLYEFYYDARIHDTSN